MDWNDQPAAQPAHSPPAEPPFTAPVAFSPGPGGEASNPARARFSGPRRTIASAVLAVGLLTVGGVAAVFAADPSASPDPSSSPQATTQPSTGGGGTAPDGTTRPNREGGSGHRGADCPNKGTDGGTSPDASAAPSTDDTTSPSPEL